MHDGRSARLRGFFARYVTARAGVQDPRIEAAFAAVPREDFAGPGPWSVAVPGFGYIRTPDDDIAFLYQDTLLAIDPARGINIGEPSLHARCLEALTLEHGETVLQVGAGVGYYTAILAQLAGEEGRVCGFEIEPDLATRAALNLAGLAGVEVQARSGIAAGLPRADAIYVNAGAPAPIRFWLDALLPGGRLVFPLQASGAFGAMLRVQRPRRGAAWPARFICTAGFIPCQGSQDEELERRLAAAFADGGWQAVRSLRLDKPAEATCWFAGEGWWLSTAEAGED
jgi:protein-L-isoaspartate(D-aspartate) O-methyltransferase